MHIPPSVFVMLLVPDVLTKTPPPSEQIRQARQDAHLQAAAAPPAGRGGEPGAADHPVRAAQLHGLLGPAAVGGHPAHHGGAGRGARRPALRRREARGVARLSEGRHPVREQPEHLPRPRRVRGLGVAAVRPSYTLSYSCVVLRSLFYISSFLFSIHFHFILLFSLRQFLHLAFFLKSISLRNTSRSFSY